MESRSEFAGERIALGMFALVVLVAILVSACKQHWRDAARLKEMVNTFEAAHPRPNMPAIVMGAMIGPGGIVVFTKTRS